MTVTVSRKDISVSEEHWYPTLETTPSKVWWEANFGGRLSTGEYVDIKDQKGDTPEEAIANLEARIRELGWEIVD